MIKYKFTSELAKEYYYGKLQPSTDGSAGIDLRVVGKEIDHLTYPAGDHVRLYTGVQFAIPKNWCGVLLPRSSLNLRLNAMLSNQVGLIDSDFRGEVSATLARVRADEELVFPDIGERFCQIVFLPHYSHDVIEVSDLDETDRAAGGFGSTGRG